MQRKKVGEVDVGEGEGEEEVEEAAHHQVVAEAEEVISHNRKTINSVKRNKIKNREEVADAAVVVVNRNRSRSSDLVHCQIMTKATSII